MASAKIIELNDGNTCQICENAFAKYTCPRCHILYCSLSCYQSQKHLQCSESFYKECVLDDVSFDKDNDESRAKMLEILEGYHERNKMSSDDENVNVDSLDSDDEVYIDIGERLAGIDLNNAGRVWEKLTSDERQDFEAFIRSDDISKIIPKWNPWWLSCNNSKVQEVDSADDYKKGCPKIKDDIYEFDKITSKPPATCVKHNLTNLIAAYAFTARYFNGEHHDFPREVASYFVTLSPCLGKNHNFEDYETAVKSIGQEAINCDWMITDEENVANMLEDVPSILNGPEPSNKIFYVLCALSDMHEVFVKALKDSGLQEKSEFSKQFPESTFPEVKLQPKQKINLCMKRIEYFLSYAKFCFE